MQNQVEIGFDKLLEMVMQLPKDKFVKLKEKINQISEENSRTEKDDFLDFLKNGPVASEEELKKFEEVDKWLREWKPD